MHAVTYPTTLWYQHTSIGTPPQKKSCYRLQYCLWFLLLTTNCSIFDIKTNQTVETLIFSMANIKDSRNQLYVDSKILLRPIFTCMLIITYYRELWIESSPQKNSWYITGMLWTKTLLQNAYFWDFKKLFWSLFT